MSKMESFATIVSGYEPLHVFYNKQLHFWVKVRVAQQIYVFKVKSCLGVAYQFPKA